MKTIHRIELITRILEGPMPFIAQRAFKLYQAYLLSFNLFSDFDIPAADELILNNYPSIEEEVESIYKLQLGTRHWSLPFKYYCEDERAHFEIAMKFILDYEKKYPNPNQIDYNLKLRGHVTNFDLLEYIGNMGYRPEMYFGTSELACLRASIDGHFYFKQFFGIEYTAFEKKLLQFIKRYKIEGNKGFKTWDRNYRWRWDFAVYGTNEKSAIPRFIRDIEEYSSFECLININDKKIKIDWSNRESWSKSARELYESSKV